MLYGATQHMVLQGAQNYMRSRLRTPLRRVIHPKPNLSNEAHLAAGVQRPLHSQSTATKFEDWRQLTKLSTNLRDRSGRGRRVLAPLLFRLPRGVPESREAKVLALGEEVGFALGTEERFGVAHEHKEEGPNRVGHNRPRVGAILRTGNAKKVRDTQVLRRRDNATCGQTPQPWARQTSALYRQA